MVGSYAFIHTRCLSNVKVALRQWNYQSFGNIQSHIADLQKQLAEANVSVGSLGRNEGMIRIEDDLKYWYNVQQEYYIQRAKENILTFDDKNTRYFHDKVKYRKRRTQIDCLQNSIGIWITDKAMLASELKDHFEKISKTTNPPTDSTFLYMIQPCISEEENEFLIHAPTDEEIKGIVWQMQPWTILGPDGYPPGFHQQMWDIVGSDTINMVKAFFISGFLLKQMNHSFVSLIPKTDIPRTATDYRPISLSNVSYKIISKLLASRLKTVMDNFISPYQASFLSSRQITDNIVSAHELVDTIRKNKSISGLMAVKLDMSKAFDRIEWKFVIDILRRLGFHDHWCKMIEQCITTVSTSIPLNGSPGEVFYPTRGLRQEDPLSPYFFIICMDIFSKMLITT